IENNYSKLFIFSRFSNEPQFYHDSGNNEYDDQYWILIPGTEKHFEQKFNFKMDKNEVHKSIFEYSSEFIIKVGIEFQAEIPSIGENGINIEVNDKIWIF
ncbi:19968_t:CDS:2, partial [Funneliformis geosporum]